MASHALRQEVDELREYMKELSYQAMRTDMAVNRLSEEMREFKDETRRDRQRMNKQWGDLANRLGTLVEDIVAPSLPRVAAEQFGCDAPQLFVVRVVRRVGSETREYDAMLVCPGLVLINETKSRPQAAHIDELLDKLAELSEFFPEYEGRRIVGVLASLYPDAGVINHATRKGALVMAMGDEAMQLLNPDAVRWDDQRTALSSADHDPLL